MNENDVRPIALFFYLAFLDEKRAIEAASRAVALLRDKKSRAEPSSREEVLSVIYRVWLDSRKEKSVPTMGTASIGWIVPPGLDFEIWREFRAVSSEEEMLIAVLSAVLNFSDEEISRAVEISEGTVRYRAGHALSRLGSMLTARSSVRPS